MGVLCVQVGLAGCVLGWFLCLGCGLGFVWLWLLLWGLLLMLVVAGCGSVVVGCGVGRSSFGLKYWCLGGSFKKGSGYISTVV